MSGFSLGDEEAPEEGMTCIDVAPITEPDEPGVVKLQVGEYVLSLTWIEAMALGMDLMAWASHGARTAGADYETMVRVAREQQAACAHSFRERHG